MYSETDLDLVSSSIPIYTKATLIPKTKKPKRGHFKCSGCDANRLSGSKTYITALVYDFDIVGPCFAFLFSRGDVHYSMPNDPFTRLMITTVNYDWIYRDKEQVRQTQIHVRGWWDTLRDTKFKHKNGIINLADHVDFDDPETDDGEVINPEFGIKLFIAPYAGMYRTWKDIEQISAWDEKTTYDHTFIHPNTDALANISIPKWNRYGEKAPPKHKRGVRTRRYDGLTARQRTEQQLLIDVEDHHRETLRAMDENVARQRTRTTRGNLQPRPTAFIEDNNLNPNTVGFNVRDNGIPNVRLNQDPWIQAPIDLDEGNEI